MSQIDDVSPELENILEEAKQAELAESPSSKN